MNYLNEWEQKIRRQMTEHGEPAPAGGWERIEAELEAAGGGADGRHRRLHAAWRATGICAAAAAALLLLLPSTQEDAGTGAGYTIKPQALTLAAKGNTATEQAGTDTPQEPVAPQVRRLVRQRAYTVKTDGESAQDAAPAAAEKEVMAVAAAADENATQSKATNQMHIRGSRKIAATPAPETGNPVQKKRPDDEWSRQTGTKSRRRPEFRLAMAGGTPASINREGYAFRPAQAAAGNLSLKLPEGTLDRFPALLVGNAGNEVESHIRHKLPLQVALTASMPLGRRFALESGLSYTRLQSEMTSGSAESYMSTTQRLHYLGIPLRLRYDIAAASRLSFYASGGGSVELCVDGEQRTSYSLAEVQSGSTERRSVGRGLWQGSLSLGAGAHCGLLPHVGLFVEPGLTYYLPDGSSLPSARHDHPLRFSLQMGLRWSLNGTGDK